LKEILARLRDRIGECVHTDSDSLARHRRDTWVLSELDDLEGNPPPLPLAVVAATTTEHVSATLEICRELRVPVVPFGGGSGVCGGIRLPEDVVVLSTRGIDRLVEIDPACLTASFGAGTLGIDAEQRVRREGLTIGQWPQSIELSTVGGWVATRAAGQFSTAYGNICCRTERCFARAARRAPRPGRTCGSSSSAARERSAW
jgi:alkyldihydroxyacetonephosphate synthase